MDGIGFIATLHATTLDDQGLRPVLLKPIKRDARRVSASSITQRAKSLVSKSKSIFAVRNPSSAASSSRTRSVVSSLASRSDHGHAHGSAQSVVESHSSYVATSIPVWAPSDDPPRTHDKSPSYSPTAFILFSAPPPMFKPSQNLRTEVWFDPHFDPSWISTFVDNNYMFPPASSPHSQSSYDTECGFCYLDNDAHPDSSTLHSHSSSSASTIQKSPQLQPISHLPTFNLSTTDQLVRSLDPDPDQKTCLTEHNSLGLRLEPALTHIPPKRFLEVQSALATT